MLFVHHYHTKQTLLTTYGYIIEHVESNLNINSIANIGSIKISQKGANA